MSRKEAENRKEIIRAIGHLALAALIVVGMVVCAVQVFRNNGGKDHHPKKDKDAWNVSYSDRRDPARNYAATFSDLQETQLQAAMKNGIREAITRDNVDGLGMVHIETNGHYVVDELTHSVPWLVPKAATLLDDIGKAFQDSLYRRGYNRHHRIIVTSVTRTRDDVRRLSRQNVNATENSCHCYGTTVDITYVRYDKPEERAASDEKLRALLMQTVYDLREQGRCYVKYERKQACLHITVR